LSEGSHDLVELVVWLREMRFEYLSHLKEVVDLLHDLLLGLRVLENLLFEDSVLLEHE
jgi:hypothetical protein